MCGSSLYSYSTSSHRESQKGSCKESSMREPLPRGGWSTQLHHSPHREAGVGRQKPESSDSDSFFSSGAHDRCGQEFCIPEKDLSETLVWLPHDQDEQRHTGEGFHICTSRLLKQLSFAKKWLGCVEPRPHPVQDCC